MGYKRLGLDIVTDMVLTETAIMDTEYESAEVDDFMGLMDDIDEISESVLPYTEDMVPVFLNENGSYLIEHEDILRMINSYELEGKYMTEELALDKIIESNNLDSNSEIYLVVESDMTYRRQVFSLSEKIRNTKDPRAKQVLKLKLATMKDRFRRMKSSDRIKLLRKKVGNKPVSKPESAPSEDTDSSKTK